MSRHLEIEEMQRPFAKSVAYLQRNFMAHVGQAGVCVYGALVQMVEDGNTNPTYEEVASAAGCKEVALRNALDKLASFAIITKVRRSDRRGSKLSNLYKLNDPDSWHGAPAIPAMENITGSYPVMNIITPPAMNLITPPAMENITGLYPAMNIIAPPAMENVAGVKGDSDGDITSVSMAEVAPAMENIAPPAMENVALSSSSSSSFFDLSKDLLEEDTRSTLPSFTFTSGSRDLPRAREETPKPPNKSDLPFAKIERMWQINCGKVNPAIEEMLWGFYLKYGAEMLAEGLNQAITGNTRGDKPSKRFIEAVLERINREQRADEIRRKAIESRATPDGRPESALPVFAEESKRMTRMFKRFRENHTDQKEDGKSE